jgi:hypothetical protein
MDYTDSAYLPKQKSHPSVAFLFWGILNDKSGQKKLGQEKISVIH